MGRVSCPVRRVGTPAEGEDARIHDRVSASISRDQGPREDTDAWRSAEEQ
jgi:hypothetical protein